MGVSEPSDAPRRVTTRSSDTSSISITPSYLSWAGVRYPTIFNTLATSPVLHRTTSGDKKPSIRVYLLRQICAKVHGQKAWKNVVLGEGKLSPLEHPPSWSPSPSSFGEEDHALDWEGEVRCNEDVTTASFIAGELLVKVRAHLCARRLYS